MPRMPRERAADCRRRFSKKEAPGGIGISVGRPNLTAEESIDYIRALAVELYGDQKKLPKIYTVLYGADPAGEAFLQALARDFHGRSRKIRGLASPVKMKD